jgi:hypothetical protein
MTRPILDRRVGHEPTNLAYPIRTLVDDTPTKAVWWTPGRQLDQADTGHCVGFSCTGEASASPTRVLGTSNDYAHAWYYEIKSKKYDPWGLEDGSSVNAGMRVGRDRGLWTGWRWAFGVADVKRALTVGPVVIGINWYEEMFLPDEDGYIEPSGPVAGGHAILVNGWSPSYYKTGKPTFRLKNSWGSEWGANGNCYLLEGHLAELLAADGEAAVPVGRAL